MARAARLPRSPLVSAVVAGLGVLMVAGCGSSNTDSTADNPAGGFRVTYKLTGSSGSEDMNFDKLDVLTDGRAKVRTTIGVFGSKAEVARIVSDGSHVVAFIPNEKNGGYGAGSSYAEEKMSEVEHYVLREGDGSLAAWCADAKPAEAAQVLGRSARHYTCTDPGDEELEQAKELWVDQQTGLVLKWNGGGDDFVTGTAIGVDVHARLPADAFSVQPAPGATPEPSP